MKKTALVIVLALALVFAFASTAFADTTSTYLLWSAAGTNAANPTPHYGYTTTTQKCIVCHAAHKATASGEVLLSSTVLGACDYCHITNAVSSVHVYNNDPNLHSVANDQAHNNSCTACHAVHGAGVITASDLEQKILKNGVAQAAPVLPVAWDKSSAGTDRAGALSAFCTQCHPYYTGVYADATAAGDITYSATAYNSHIMTSDITDYSNTAATYAAGAADVAWAASTYCTNCHDAGADTVANNFPHYTDGARFMKSAANVEGVAAATGAASPTEDGVCLKCHVSTAAAAGAGVTF